MKKKRIISALMAMAMCVSALPMSVCAEDNAVAPKPFVEKEYDFPNEDTVAYWKFLDRFDYDYWLNPDMFEYEDVEFLEFTQKLYDNLLKPEESEENRLIYNYAKRQYDRRLAIAKHYNRSYYDTFLGVQKNAEGTYTLYCLSSLNPEENFADNHKNDRFIDGDAFVNLKIAQCINRKNDISGLQYIDNPYITEEEFYTLSYADKIITAEKIYEETGEDIVDSISPAVAFNNSLYIDTDGKAHDCKGKEMDIVDGKIVEVADINLDNSDVLNTETLIGDANEDGKVNIADAVFIMQALSNPDGFLLSEQGALNADYNEDGGVTTADALAIQMIDIS